MLFDVSNDFTELHIAQDAAQDFFAVIALHRYGRGPALGGCRFVEYSSKNDAIQDAIRLSYAMGCKAAISDLPLDGGKAVILKPKNIKNREAIFNRFAAFVDSLNGKYITTVDSGTQARDMALIKNNTAHVAGYLQHEENNPSNATALGVLRGIQAALQLKVGDSSLQNVKVAIQGVGSVGTRLARLLNQEGAKLIICDADNEAAKRCAEETGAMLVEPEKIFDVDCDVFSPCALSRAINELSFPKIKASIIAGAANDQLCDESMANKLHEKNILYVPDYVINAGGLIHLALEIENKNKQEINAAVNQIRERVAHLGVLANDQNKTIYQVAKESVEAMRA